ncbi:MAG: hypothetical protein DI535_14715 [Citrobacter freundii]|nr:MAG: hypothetical protein DI535_14715 [Citrobacter freundii]
MQFWDTVISTMLMGTEKKMVQASDLPAGLAGAYAMIEQNTTIDREEKFLQLASLAFNYRQSGIIPPGFEGELAEVPEEILPYCPPRSQQVLKDILDENVTALLALWLKKCEQAQKIVTPDLIPALYNEAQQHKKLQPLIVNVCGHRGQWLAKFNPLWKFASFETDEEIWQTGTLEQRKYVLIAMRQQDRARAIEWIKQTWAQEDANTRAALLEVISNSLTPDDLLFLESLSEDKSKKVKDLAKKLLKQIPGSSTVLLYQQLLKESVQLVKEKTMLGMSSKTTLKFNLPATTDENLFKTGIDKLSPDKQLTDTEYIFHQLIQSVPPSFWEALLQSDPAGVIDLFQKDQTGKKLISAIVIATATFKDRTWAQVFSKFSNTFYPDIIPLLPEQEQDAYSEKFFDQHTESVLYYATQRSQEWSHSFTLKILKHAATNPYQFNKPFYTHYINLIPLSILPELDQFSPGEKYQYDYWRNVQDHLKKILALKQQTLNAFNA